MSVPLNEKISTVLSLLKKPRLLNALISFKHSGYLVETGWINSFLKSAPLDKGGNPLPWFTLPCIEILKERLTTDLNVFEFGAGNSTLFFSSMVKKVSSIESDKEWFANLKEKVASNVNLTYHIIDNDYPLLAKASDEKYDIILIDAEKRNECIANSISVLTDKGIIILDDSERIEYSESVIKLKNLGFNELTFWGISPGCLYNKATSIFYKRHNCLRI